MSTWIWSIKLPLAQDDILIYKQLSHAYRAVGIVVPIFHNDVGMTRSWLPKKYPGVLDIYGLDGYPRVRSLFPLGVHGNLIEIRVSIVITHWGIST